MNTLQSCLTYLDRSGVRYTHTTHPPAFTAREVAVAEFMPAHRVAKAVVLRGDRGYVLVLVPADSFVDLEQLRTAIASQRLEVANETELLNLFPEAELGAMAPLTAVAEMPIYLDRALAAQEFITFTAGTHKDVIHMKTDDFCSLTEPVIGDFGRPDELEATPSE